MMITVIIMVMMMMIMMMMLMMMMIMVTKVGKHNRGDAAPTAQFDEAENCQPSIGQLTH